MKTRYAAVIHLKSGHDILSSLLFGSYGEARRWAADNEGARGIYGCTIIRVHIR